MTELKHPELTPEVLDRLNEALEKFERHAKPQDGMVIEVARMMSQAWRAGQAGRHPEIAVMTDLCRQVVHGAMMLGGCNMAEFYLKHLREDKTIPEEVFTKEGQEIYWAMVHNTHADMYNELTKSLPNLADHAYRDTPGPLPPFPWDTPDETKEGANPGTDRRDATAGCESQSTRVQAGAAPTEMPQDRGMADPGPRRGPAKA